MIDIISYEDGLPVSVIIPLSTKREKFFFDFVFPLIESMGAKEIIINNDIGGACKKRNDGFKKSTQPYILFADDDILFPKSFLEKLLDALNKNKNIGYAYTGYKGIVLTHTHPIGKNYDIRTIPFNGESLKRANYISTMSLIRREVFPMFDENLKRFHDWDLWLTLLNKGIEGVAVFDLEFFAYYLDEGITSNTNNEQEAILAIIRKHNLGL